MLDPGLVPATGDTAQRRTWLRVGGWLMTLWLAGGVVVITVVAKTGGSPFTYFVALQQQAVGSADLTVAALPMAFVWIAPMFVIGLRRWKSPLLAGAAKVLNSTNDTVDGPHPRASLRRRALSLVAAAAASLVVAAGLAVHSYRTTPAGGQPLPTMTVAAIIGRDPVLPTYVRLTDGVVDTRIAYETTSTLRQDRYHEVFHAVRADDVVDTPLRLVVDDGYYLDSDRPPPVPPPVLAGRLRTGRLPEWQLAALRRAGLPVADNVIVLDRQRLNSSVPDERGAGAVLPFVVALPLAAVLLLIARQQWRLRATYED